MNPVPAIPTFTDEKAVVFAEDQPQYRPLPAIKSADGRVTTKWKLTWAERFTVLFGGHLWLQVLTFNRPLQPVKLSVHEPQTFADGLAERPASVG